MALKLNPSSGELDLVINPGGGIAATDFSTDSGSAVPAAGGVITIAGGTGINTAGAGNTVTINLDDPVIVGDGGTGRTTLTDGAFIIGNGTTAVELIGPLTDGQVLIGNTVGVSPIASTLTEGEHIEITNAGGSITIGWTDNADETAVHGWNGAIIESPAIVVTSDGATIRLSLERSGGGDLTMIFSDEFSVLDTTPAINIVLTAGTDTVPVLNYIYIPQSTKVLTVNTSSFPSAEHIPVATVLCQSAASLQTEGCYKCHAWTDHVQDSNNQGHISDINSWIRSQQASWVSGVGQTFTITSNGGAADNVILTTAAGVVLQLHDHTFPAFSGTPDVYTVNDSVTPFNKVTDLNALLTDSAGVSMSGKFFSLVIWGVVSEATGDCKLMVNLPSGSYNNATSVSVDASKFANFTIPADFVGTGFLIAQWNLRHQVAASGTWTSIDEIDLRGLLPAIEAGGSTASPSEFTDDVFRVLDDSDNTKELAFQCSGITTATTRTLTVPDDSGTIALQTGVVANSVVIGNSATEVTATAALTDGMLPVGISSSSPIALLSSMVSVPGGWLWNLGCSLSAGTFTIHGSDGTALSAANPGFILMKDTSTQGQFKHYKITANQSFDDATAGGGSDITGNLWSTVTTVAYGSAKPFFIYVMINDAQDTPLFALCDVPHRTFAPAAANIGAPDDAVADVAADMWSFTNLDETLYNGNNVLCVGSIRMTKDGSDDWTITALDSADGLGVFQEGRQFTFPTGQFGAASGTHLLDNGGTAPIFGTNEVFYQITKDGYVDVWYNIRDDGGADGAGAVQSKVSIPILCNDWGFTDNPFTSNSFLINSDGTGAIDVISELEEGTNDFVIISTALVSVENGDFTNGARYLLGRVYYWAYPGV